MFAFLALYRRIGLFADKNKYYVKNECCRGVAEYIYPHIRDSGAAVGYQLYRLIGKGYECREDKSCRKRLRCKRESSRYP